MAAADKLAAANKAAGAVVIKRNAFVSPVSIDAPAAKVVNPLVTTTTALKIGKPLEMKLPSVAKGSAVFVTVKLPNGKLIKVAQTKTKKSGAYSVPALQFAEAGTYAMTVKIGNQTKIVRVVVK